MTSPWERLREAAKRFIDDQSELNRMRVDDALVGLPATPPEQPVPDAERERAIEIAIQNYAVACSSGTISSRDEPRERLRALMRSAPAPQPVTGFGGQWTWVPSNGAEAEFCDACGGAKPPKKPVPAPPASDWRERFDMWVKASSLWDTIEAMHDGIVALEAEVARLKEKP